ncbi:hypothetical protein [uncultured Bifidobacterium sp.]|uniref:hypothetical protein n=1 Tax=uncultured Bifidobacterium sp. TaxID=165187 RepID=UPI0025958B29|nr:hypothetical protein [uncultured Bifidobacterium sp.]
MGPARTCSAHYGDPCAVFRLTTGGLHLHPGPCRRRFEALAPRSRGYSASGDGPLPQKKDGESNPEEAEAFPPDQSDDALATPPISTDED